MPNPNMSKYDYVLECNKDNMDSIALSFENRQISYEELFESIERYSKLLYSKGVRQGDLIGICVLNTPEAVYLLYALNKIGAVVIGFSPFDSKERIKADLELTKPKMIITADYSYSSFKDLEKSLNFTTIQYPLLGSSDDWKLKIGYNILKIKNGNYTFDKNRRLDYLLRRNLDSFCLPNTMYSEESLSDIMFTGGSSGIHKGVMLSDVGLNASIEGMTPLCDDGYFNYKTYLGQIPFGHMAFGRSILHVALTQKMTFALTLKTFPKDFYNELVRTKANVASGGPPHWTSLIEKVEGKYVPRKDLIKNSLVNLETAFSGGEALKDITEAPINEALTYCGSNAKIGEGLGATETWGTSILNFANYYKKGTLGVPISTLKIKLIDPETKQVVNKGEKGLLYLSGLPVMLGYYQNAEETAKVISFDQEGKKWLNLGDYLVELDNGFYKYVGRQKRNFVCDCDNIYPEQIEELLSGFSEIREAVVTAIPDDTMQFVPSYHISLYSEDTDLDRLEQQYKALIKEKICKNALPGKIEYTTEPLVRMTNSKIDLEFYKKRDS